MFCQEAKHVVKSMDYLIWLPKTCDGLWTEVVVHFIL